jgi:diacylglycerol kinase (ATP)
LNTLCLYNPKAGRFSLAALEKAFAGRAFWGDVRYESLAGPEGRQWHRKLGGYGRIAVFGGDGTIHHIIQELAFTETELCVFPAGTANDLVCAIGVPMEWERTLDLFERGKTLAYDTIEVNGRHVITGGGFGLGYQAAASANKLRSGPLGGVFRKCLRAKIYLVTLAWHGLLAPPRRVHFKMRIEGVDSMRPEDGAIEGETQSILFCNQALMGKRVLIAPGTSPFDGRFHLVRFLNGNSAGILRTLGYLKSGSSKAEAMLARAEVSFVEIDFAEPVPAYGDGEEFPPQTHWELKCHRGSVKLRVPADFGQSDA